MQVIPSESVEYLPVPVDGPGTITALPVEMQVRLYPLRPDPAGWKTAGWGVADDGQIVAQVLIGSGSGVGLLEPGTYVPYVLVTATPELPVIEGNPIRIS